MKHVIGPMAGLFMSAALSGCAGMAVDAVSLAQAVKVLNEGCERTVDLSVDRSQPGGGSLKVTRVCAPAEPAEPRP
jgi:hypothetical protein